MPSVRTSLRVLLLAASAARPFLRRVQQRRGEIRRDIERTLSQAVK